MATFTKVKLSGSTDGKGIKVVNTSAGAADTIHTGSSTATTYDEIYLYAVNMHTADVDLTILWGAAGNPDDYIQLTIPYKSGLYLIVPGLLIKGNATPLVVKAFAATANVVMIHGWINQIAA